MCAIQTYITPALHPVKKNLNVMNTPFFVLNEMHEIFWKVNYFSIQRRYITPTLKVCYESTYICSE